MVGRTVQQYQFLEKLGAGGMGEVYKARDTRLNRLVAIKVLNSAMSANAEQRRRFIHEAQAASSLNHPGIITIYDIFTDADTEYMVAEFVNGKTLLQLISSGALRVPPAIDYAIQMADALSAAHAAGIIHRDIKPANVMVTASGLVKVLDFGLAKIVEGLAGDHSGTTVTAINAPFTVAGAVMGTVNYMSPEQAQSQRLTVRSDIFSFGAVLYEMLTGHCAFRGGSPVSTLSAVLRDDVRPMVELTPDVPPELDHIVALCLKKDPDQRFQSMREVHAALVQLRRRYDSGAPYDEPTVRTIVPPAPRGSKLPGIAAVVVLAAAAIGAGTWWMTRYRSEPPPVTSPPTSVAPSAPVAAVAAPDGTLTNNSIVAMAEAKVAPNTIIGQIRASKTDFNLSAAEVIRLTKAGVSSDVIEAMRNPQPAPAPAAAPAILRDGSPVYLTLAKDIPSDAQPGDLVSFSVADDVTVAGAVVIAKGAPAAGAIVDSAKRKALVMRGKMTFLLESVDAVDGQKVPLRATPQRRHGELSKSAVSTGGEKSKEVAASAGAGYTGYIDGTITVMVKK